MGTFNSIWPRRCVAVDLGQRRVKIVLVEATGDQVEVLHALSIDLHEEGLLTPEEASRHVGRVIQDLGPGPVSVVAPQDIAISHLVSLPANVRGRWRRVVEEEAQKLTGLSDISIIYGYQRLQPMPRDPNPLWVTVSREKDLNNHLDRLGDARGQVSEIVNTGSALASAYIASKATENRVALVEIGAASTTVVVMEDRQPIYSTHFPFGGDFFTDLLSEGMGLGVEEAENAKKTEALLTGTKATTGFQQAVGRWREELEKILLDWAREQDEGTTAPNRIYVGGGGSQPPDLLEFLNARSPFAFAGWDGLLAGIDARNYAAVYGGALAGLRQAEIAPSLLPKPVRKQQRLIRQTVLLNLASVFLLLGALFVLAADTLSRQEVLQSKQARLADLEAAFERIEEVQELRDQRTAEYNRIVPVIQRHQMTRDLLKTVTLMQDIRAEHDLWFVAFADRRSYLVESTRREGRARNSSGSARRADSATAGDPVGLEVPKAFVIEVTVLDEGRNTHRVLRNVVETLKVDGNFRDVDVMPDVERTEVAYSRVTLPGRTFALNLELMPGELPLSVSDEEEDRGGRRVLFNR